MEAAFTWDAFKEASQVRFTHAHLKMPGIGKDTTIVVLADQHAAEKGNDRINPLVSRQLMIDINAELVTSGCKPKSTIVLAVGDEVSETTRWNRPTGMQAAEEIIKAFSSINAAHFFNTVGNHEELHPNLSQLLDLYKVNKRVCLGRSDHASFIQREQYLKSELPFVIIGLPDFTTQSNWYESEAFEQVLKYLLMKPENEPVILITHNAEFISPMVAELLKDVKNLIIICGHSHGGQLGGNDWRLPLNAAVNWAARQHVDYGSPFINGWYCLDDADPNAVRILVSPGIGETNGYPRTVQSEVFFLHITR